MNENSINKLIEKQRTYFNNGNCKSLDFRIQQLKKLKKCLKENESDILQALYLDLGKSEVEAYMSEVGFVYAEIDFMIKNLKSFARPAKVKTPLLYLGAKSSIYSDPLGLVLVIGPWNYPFQLLIAPLVGSMAAGNCTILKPSEFAPHCSELLNNLIKNTFIADYIAVVEGAIPECSSLLNQKFDYIFYTGGSYAGRIVMEAAARNLTPLTLELGGKSPCIVDRDVNITKTARRIAWGKYLNAGQTCVAPDYLMVHRDIKNDLLKAIKESILDFYGSDPLQSKHYSRIINDRHFMRLIALLYDSQIVWGGQNKREEKFIAPTIIENVSLESPVMQEEIFGPILPVLEYEDLHKVIEHINSRPKPLALYFFSRDKIKQKKILSQSSSGGVCINDTLSHITTRTLPFGGVGESGIGQYHGKASFDTFSHKKSVLNNKFFLDASIKYPPYNISLSKIKKLMKYV